MKNLFKTDGTGLSEINEGIEKRVNAFVDDIVSEYGDVYNGAELELYAIESIINRFGYHRMMKHISKRFNQESED